MTWRPLLVALGLLGFAVLATGAAWRKSVTGDEVAHLPSGYTYVRTGDFRLNRQHPPLIKALAGLPLLALDLKPVAASPGWHESNEWTFGRDFLIHNRTPIETIVRAARLPMVAVGALLGWVLFRWARELWGFGAATVVLMLFVLCPNVLAHAPLVTTDVGVACFSVLSLYGLWRFSRGAAYSDAALCGLGLGLALLAKYSGILTLALVAALLGLLFLTGLWAALRPQSPWNQVALPGGRRVLGAVVIIGVSALTIVALGFDAPRGLSNWIAGFRHVYADANPRWQGFLWGEYSRDGFRQYYVLAQLWKMPLPSLLLGLGGLAFVLFARRDRRRLLDWAFVAGPFVAWHAAFAFHEANIGVRHVLPAFPFFFLSAGRAAQALLRRGTVGRGTLGLLALWLLVGTGRAYPNFLSYFNQIVGGPKNGIHYLDDSNVEWGQDLYLVRDYLEAHRPTTVRFFATEPVPRRALGIEAQNMRLRDVVWPEPGVTYVVGAHYLQRNSLYNRYPNVRFQWLRSYEPIERLGGSIYVYRFSTDPAAAADTTVVYLPRERWYADAVDRLREILDRSPRFREAGDLLARIEAEAVRR